MIDIQVVLVNEADESIGVMEKMVAHQSPHLHRAFSIFLFSKSGKMLLQQRAYAKYHSGGLWTNSCCSHPLPDEDVMTAAYRRLQEELGIVDVKLIKAFDFIYNAEFDNGLFEFEFDHVFIGEYDGDILPNADEVHHYCYKHIGDIKTELNHSPETFTPWFKIALPKLEAFLISQNGVSHK